MIKLSTWQLMWARNRVSKHLPSIIKWEDINCYEKTKAVSWKRPGRCHSFWEINVFSIEKLLGHFLSILSSLERTNNLFFPSPQTWKHKFVLWYYNGTNYAPTAIKISRARVIGHSLLGPQMCNYTDSSFRKLAHYKLSNTLLKVFVPICLSHQETGLISIKVIYVMLLPLILPSF